MITRTITIKTNRLILRQIKIEDAKAMYNNWANDNDVTKYLSWNPHQSVDDTKKIIISWINQYNNDYYFHWVIEYNNDVIGTISLFNLVNNSLELGYCISKKYWNRGLTTEAAHAVIDFAFNHIGVNAVYARHVDVNIASGKVMQKNNMKYLSSNSEYISLKNQLVNMKKYVVYKEEFK